MTSTAHLSSNLATNCKLFKIRQTYPIIITASNGLSLLSFYYQIYLPLLLNCCHCSVSFILSPGITESLFLEFSLFGYCRVFFHPSISLTRLTQTFKNSSRFNHNFFLFYSYVLIIINFLSRLEDIYIHPPLHRLKLLMQVHISVTWLVFALCNFRFPTFC